MTIKTQLALPERPCSDPLEPPGLKAVICEATTRACTARHGSGLRAIVLTGSMARGEATFVREGNGYAVVGDAEFLVVFQDRVPLPKAGDADSLRRQIRECLLQQNIDCPIALSQVHGKFLQRLRPHIFACELRTHGEVVWGEAEILSLIPKFSEDAIPLEDAWRLLNNRMIELLEVADQLAGTTEYVPRSVLYKAVKLYLDMATSLLLFAGCYAPTYQQRQARLLHLAEHAGEGEWPVPLTAFAELVGTATQWKAGMTATIPPVSWEFCRTASAYAYRLWVWELRLLTGLGGTATDRDLMFQWMRLQPRSQRLRGWLYVLRAHGWIGGWRQWPRWARLALRASPRYWIYAAAAALLARLPSLVRAPATDTAPEAEWTRVREWLPVKVLRKGGGSLSWKELAAEVAWNYKNLLTETRA